MSHTRFIQLSREQLRLLQEAKRRVKKEFNSELKLQSSDVLDQLYGLALTSKQGILLELYKQLAPKSIEPKASNRVRYESVSKSKAAISKEVKVGDIVDGQECTSLYRGQPVFRSAN